MFLDYCLEHRDQLIPSLTEAARDAARRLASEHPPPPGIEPGAVVALAASTLAARAREGRREGVRILELPRFEPGEHGRLTAKGRALYEHCLSERSRVCVVGFFEYQLARDPRARAVVLELLGWMVDERLERPDLEPALAASMIDAGVALLHGLSS